MDSVRCMFDAYEPKQQQQLSFPLAEVYSGSGSGPASASEAKPPAQAPAQAQAQAQAKATLDVEIISATENDPAALQSGIYMWPASRALSHYICSQPASSFNQNKAPVHILELGAGVGLAGIVAFKRVSCLNLKAHVVLTDRDQVSVDLLSQNLSINGITSGASERLSWGRDGCGQSQVEGLLKKYGKFEWVVGSDLIYSSDVCAMLLWTVRAILNHASAGQERGMSSRFILCSSFRHEDTTKIVEEVCAEMGMRRECLQDEIGHGETMIEQFTLLPP